ncbi:septal ring lytic transglycosylase RlpA family lipoprotein [Methylocella silvestris]|uniref:Endolytic peptidoglycan transglycosylase RlpA n=2 Tax=Methylocella silvestris TaxID=199596 RepID=A0A2J7TDR2_METSI|nr:septal ring lytic transglycosylase RlpA family lipoprotein [Methylocella silvestris]
MLARRLLYISSRALARCAQFSSRANIASRLSRAPRGALLMAVVGGGAVSLGGCAQQPQLQRVAAHSKEYFPSSKYGPASARVVADGEPVPRGGGAYMVGKPYTIAGRTYYPSEKRYSAVGLASWYGDAFHGRRTANGEVYDSQAISAAHPTMPLPCYARVTNLRNHRSIVVRVNDRGPFEANRIMDVSRRTADALEFRHIGTAKVKVEYLAAASLSGSDDERLLATLRLDGPASLDDAAPTMVADATDLPTRAASLDPSVLRASAGDDLPGRPAATQPLPIARPQQSAAATASGESSLEEDAGPPRLSRQFAAAPLPPARPSALGVASGRVNVAMRAKQAD